MWMSQYFVALLSEQMRQPSCSETEVAGALVGASATIVTQIKKIEALRMLAPWARFRDILIVSSSRQRLHI
jgi:hypothetical protein